MEVVHSRCCGINVHQVSLAVCVSIKEEGKTEKYQLSCGTTTAELLRLADWLHGYHVTHVAMEATGVYWKPVWHILEGPFELLLANPVQVQALRGRKTDYKDGERIADFLQHGLLEGSFVPPQPVAGPDSQPDHTQAGTGADRQSHPQGAGRRQHKLSSVMSDVMGVSGQAMLRAMIRGESDPEALAQLARKRLRGKIPMLRQAATGTLNEHHRFLLEQWLAHWDELAERITKFDQRIEEQMRPFAPVVETWTSLPGIDRITAWTMVAELGPEMSQFPSAAHAASWAGLCPGQDESAGKRRSGRTRPGNVWLRRALTQAAWGASLTKGSYFKAFYHRLAARKGKKRAIVAVAHALLSTGYMLLWTGRKFSDLGEDYFDHLNQERLTKRLVKRLEKLGHRVALQPAA